ncbi:MAG TPA: trypsin-like peptidase domain-containing protein [Candidatus Limnocylindria bacterium]|nr:trypsin-like peptidase domain-containing protein [Candidatus Limnocylindria bacterium]
MRRFSPRQGIVSVSLVAALLSGAASGFGADPLSAGKKAGETPAGAAVEASKSAEASVVKIFATARHPDLYKPWTKQSPSESTGSGVVIEGHRILSNAHVVNYASQVQVQASQSGEKINATVEAIAPGIDLAILKLDDESFFDAHPPLPRAAMLPAIKDAVMAYGFPEGGNTLSITRGIVSRIEFAPYNYTVSGLRIQIDAAINPGNSGGPAVVGDKMIGLVFSRLGGADNIGYIIPCEEIELFLADLRDGQYDGKPAVFDELQTLENPALRPFLKLDKSVEGMVVNHPQRDDADYPLKQWDVITKIGDTPLDVQGMVNVGAELRVRFPYLVQKLAKNGKLPLTIVRAGKTLQIELPVTVSRPSPFVELLDKYPRFFVFGPIVFSPASAELQQALGENSRWLGWLGYLKNPLLLRSGDQPAFEGEQLVMVPAPFFPHRLATGYSTPSLRILKTVNGTAIKNLDHLVTVLRDSKDEFLTFEFYGRGESYVFPRKEMMQSTDDILTDNGVRSQGSPDLMAIWNAKAGGK